MKKTEPEYYPPVENLLDLIYEHYTENNPVEKNTVAGKAAKAKEKELEEWLRGLEGMDRLVDDYVGDKIPLWERIMDRQGTVCCTWEKTAFEEVQKSDAERHLHGVLATLSRCKATSQGNSSIMVTRTIYVRLIIIHGGKNGKLQRNSLPIVTEPEPAANP